MKSDTCIETPLDKSPAGTSLSFWVKKAAGGSSDEQVLFEGSSTLGDYTIKAVQKNTGKVGYSREGYDYSFDYTLPEDEWVHLTIKGYKDKAELYVNDSDTAIPAVMDTATKLGTQYRLATLNIPIKYIGSTTGNSFNGLIDEIELTNDQDDSIILQRILALPVIMSRIRHRAATVRSPMHLTEILLPYAQPVLTIHKSTSGNLYRRYGKRI